MDECVPGLEDEHDDHDDQDECSESDSDAHVCLLPCAKLVCSEGGRGASVQAGVGDFAVVLASRNWLNTEGAAEEKAAARSGRCRLAELGLAAAS